MAFTCLWPHWVFVDTQGLSLVEASRGYCFAALCWFPGGSEVKASACNAGDQVQSLGWEDPLEKEMATHCSSCLENPMEGGAW